MTTELGLPSLRGAVPTRDPARPDDPRLVDTFGRVATDLRISLTDRCNLRCTYCMPADGAGKQYTFLPRQEVLNAEELVRLAKLFVERGVQPPGSTGIHRGDSPLLRLRRPSSYNGMPARYEG